MSKNFVKLTFGGKEVKSGQLASVMLNSVLQQISESVKRTLHGLTCPEHGDTGHLEINLSSDMKKMEISGFCCEKLKTLAEQRLQGGLK